MSYSPEFPPGLDRNPIAHPDGRHEYCEGCGRYFPEADVEFSYGRFCCPACRYRALQREHRTPARYRSITDGGPAIRIVPRLEVYHPEFDDE